MELLDCTIRDGGYVNNWNFSIKDAQRIYRAVTDSDIEYIEVGFVGRAKSGCGVFQHLSKKDITKMFGSLSGAKIGVMIDFKNKTVEIPEDVDIVRVATHKDTAIPAIDFTESLSSLGYITSVQFMGFSAMSEEDINAVCDRLKSSTINYAYVADSYGSIYPSNMKNLLSPFLNLKNVKVGFHPHNGLQLAFANTLIALELGVDIIDSSLLGMGRGAGNLNTELIASYLRDKYDPLPLLTCVEDVMIRLREERYWGYQPEYMLTGIFNIHPYYAKQGRDIDKVYSSIQEVSSSTVGFSQEVLDDILDREVDLSLCSDNLERLKIDRKKIENNIKLPFALKKVVSIIELIEHYPIFKKYYKFEEIIRSLKDTMKGERCFIIATGPSLNKTDLSVIKDEYLFGVNTLYSGLKKFGIDLDYYVLGDGDVFHAHHKDLLQTDTTMFLCGAPGHYYVNNPGYYNNLSNCKIVPIQRLGRMALMSDFSKDLAKGTFISGSVTIHALQIAYYLGFSEVYLVGADCDYSSAQHFDGKKTIRREGPQMASDEGRQRVFRGYEICKRAFEKDGRKIYNSTVGGKLEVYERIPLERI